MVMAERHGANRLFLETDCLELVVLWENRANNRPAIAPILMEIHERSLRFLDFALSYVN